MKCEVQWVCTDRGCPGTAHKHVDEGIFGILTPDDNEAVGYAVSFAAFGAADRAILDEAIPICADHLARMPREGWVFLRFPEYRDEAALAAKLAEILVVTGAVRAAWPDKASEILGTLRGGSDHYSFNRWGMYVGVEHDGYIHT